MTIHKDKETEINKKTDEAKWLPTDYSRGHVDKFILEEWKQAHLELSNELEKALLILARVINQSCYMRNDEELLDSCAITSYADAMHFLSKYGKFKIESQTHRRVLGTLIKEV